jgi:hypothetical protein
MSKPDTTRERVASLIVARKAEGKSYDANQLALQYSAAHPDSAVLIIDVNCSPQYNAHRPVTMDEGIRLIRGIGRYMGTPTEKELVLLSDTLINNSKKGKFFNGMIIFEDCTGYISGNPRPVIRQFLVNHRMAQVDLVFTFHALSMVPPFFWKMTSYIWLKKTQDILQEKDKYRYPNFNELRAAHAHVMASKQQYYGEKVDTMI